MKLPLYQIVNWDGFENAKSRTYAKPQFVCVPNKAGGTGLSNVQGEPDGAAIYGVWQWILQMCSRQSVGQYHSAKGGAKVFSSSRDGWLTADGKKDGRRLSSRELANMFRRPLEEIYRCLQVVSSPEVDFIRLVDGHHEFLSEIPQGDRSIPPPPEVSRSDTGSQPDTNGILDSDHGISSADTERKKEQKEILSQRGRDPADSKDTSPTVNGDQPDTAVSGDGAGTDEPNGPNSETPPDVIQHAEAKRLFGDLALAVFGKTIRETQWPHELEHHLDAALPLPRESWRLIDWFYGLQEDHPILAVTMRRQSFESLIRNLGEEPQKIRSARKKIGLNGLSETGDVIPESDGWTPARKKAAAELYGDRELPERFSQMPASARTEIERRVGEGTPT